MAYQTICYENADGLAVITLNRPQTMNALNTRMRQELTEAVQRASVEARCIVLTGTGGAFCSGQDLSDFDSPVGIPFEAVLRDEYVPLLKAIYDCPVPTISAVNGAAAGAGANLALAADVVIASQAASFIQAFTKIGLIPDAGGTYWLPRQIGSARAMGACLFADKVSAQQAADWGMIYEAVAEEAFGAHWRARAQSLAKGPTLAYRHVKTALRGASETSLDAQLALEARLQQECGQSADFVEGVSAFLQKRPAQYQGR